MLLFLVQFLHIVDQFMSHCCVHYYSLLLHLEVWSLFLLALPKILPVRSRISKWTVVVRYDRHVIIIAAKFLFPPVHTWFRHGIFVYVE